MYLSQQTVVLSQLTLIYTHHLCIDHLINDLTRCEIVRFVLSNICSLTIPYV